MSGFHCGMDEVKLVNNIHRIKSFSEPQLGKGWLFYLWFPYIDSDWFSSLLSLQWYDSSIPIFSASFSSLYPFCWNHHFGIKSDEICTLFPNWLRTHSNHPRASLIPEQFLGCWIPSIILVRTGLGCQRFAQKFIQHVDNFRPCKHTVP